MNMNSAGFQSTLAALLCLSAVALSGCNSSDAHAQARQGSQPSAWGAPYSNMPDIVPPNVRGRQMRRLVPVSIHVSPPTRRISLISVRPCAFC